MTNVFPTIKEESMKIVKSYECPYCGIRNVVNLEFECIYPFKTVATCDMDEGGCDKDFVVIATPRIDDKVLKIEGVL